jgi:hypothetical protein
LLMCVSALSVMCLPAVVRDQVMDVG